MACNLKSKHDIAYGIREQSTWGTAEAGTSVFVRLDCEPADIDPDAKYVELNRVSAYRDLDKNSLIYHTKGSAPKFQVIGDIKKNDIALFLYAVMQNVTEAVGTPFTKTFIFPENGQPDFSAGEGIIFTVAKKMPVIASSMSFKDALCSKLNLVWAPETETGIGKITAQMVGRGTVNDTYDMTAATLTPNANTLFYFHDLEVCTVNISGAQAVIPTRIEIEIGNNAVPISVDQVATGQFACVILPIYYCTAKIACAWDANVETVRKEAKATSTSSDRQWIVEWGTAGADGHLKFDMNAQAGPAPHVDGDLNTVEFTLKCLRDGATKPLTVTLSDTVDRVW